MIEGKNILITGGSGFLASYLIPRILEQKPRSVLCVARNEGKLMEMANKYPDSGIDILAGDIADPWVAAKAMNKIDGVFHLGAFKHVRMAEDMPMECYKSNLVGTANLLRESMTQLPKFFMFISTDKAAQVKGIYGATKKISEKLLEEIQSFNPATAYRCVRYGNIMYSTGSVMCLWKEALQKGEPVKIADPNMTRFYWTADQAVDLIFDCLKNAPDAKPWMPTMKAIRLGDLLTAMVEKYGNGKISEVRTTGATPADNMHETLDGKTFSNEVALYTIEQIKSMI